RVHQNRKLRCQLPADLIVRRDNAWPNENGRNTRVLGRTPLKSVNIFALAGDGALAADHSMRLPHEVISRTRVPGYVVGKMITLRPVAPQCELSIRFREKILVTQRSLPAENPIVRPRAECEIVSVNPTFRRPGNFHLMKFLLQPAGIAGGKFDSSQRNQ